MSGCPGLPETQTGCRLVQAAQVQSHGLHLASRAFTVLRTLDIGAGTDLFFLPGVLMVLTQTGEHQLGRCPPICNIVVSPKHHIHAASCGL